MTSRIKDDSDVGGAPGGYGEAGLAGLMLALVTAANEAGGAGDALQAAVDHICAFTGAVFGHAYVADSTGVLRSSDIWNSKLSPAYAFFKSRTATLSFRADEGHIGIAASSRRPVWVIDYPAAHRSRSQAAAECGLVTAFSIPVPARDGHVAAVLDFYTSDRREADETLLDTLTMAAIQLGKAFERDWKVADIAARAEHLERQVRHTDVIRHIDRTIIGNGALSATLDLITAKIVTELDAGDAHILICDPEDFTLEIMPCISPAVRAIEFPSERMVTDPARRAATEREAVRIDDVQDLEPHEALPGYMSRAGIRSCFAIPLMTDGVLSGVLEVCSKTVTKPDEHWLSLLHTLSAQAAAALESSRLCTDMQRDNAMMRDALDKLLYAWARTMEMRGIEPEGHTHRVAKLSALMAEAMKLTDDETLRVRRGALVHDIGLLGLTDAEADLDVHGRHPALALALLRTIDLLETSLDIPCFHHERWDGNGFPNALAGDDIPAPARLFAVCHAFDMMICARPHGRELPFDSALASLAGMGGSSFDPEMVTHFLGLDLSEVYPDAFESLEMLEAA